MLVLSGVLFGRKVSAVCSIVKIDVGSYLDLVVLRLSTGLRISSMRLMMLPSQLRGHTCSGQGPGQFRSACSGVYAEAARRSINLLKGIYLLTGDYRFINQFINPEKTIVLT